jgi:DNA-binding CsgD family transcriptional regulator
MKTKLNKKIQILSPQEITCLKWVKKGKTIEEIALILALKPGTVKSYFRTIRFKLNCTTMAQALYKAIKLKLITL